MSSARARFIRTDTMPKSSSSHIHRGLYADGERLLRGAGSWLVLAERRLLELASAMRPESATVITAAFRDRAGAAGG
jgi:hypothetical protein